MVEVTLGYLEASELRQAASLIGRAFRDNPVTIAANHRGPNSRTRGAEGTLGFAIGMLDGPQLVARRCGWIVGVCGAAPPGTCRMPFSKSIRLIPGAMAGGPGAVVRMMHFLDQSEKHDPDELHWHLGPVAVEPALQGMSVGSRLLERFCEGMDAKGDLAYLDTDKPENVRFYERFGFVVIEEDELIGVPYWFMHREPRKTKAGTDASRGRAQPARRADSAPAR